MIKKHLKNIYTCDLPNNFLETATKENFRTYQRKSKYGRIPMFVKFLTLFGQGRMQGAATTANAAP